jgi:AcrR family transcriptional regulator
VHDHRRRGDGGGVAERVELEELLLAHHGELVPVRGHVAPRRVQVVVVGPGDRTVVERGRIDLVAFAEQGFDRTTVDEIAAAAGVSRRTFFHYFESKEDVVLARHEDFERALLDVVRAAAPDEPVLDVAERAVVAAAGQFDLDEARIIEQLQRDEPALRMRAQGKYERMERAIAGALAERAGVAPDDLRVRLDAMLIAGVLRIAGGGWTAAAMTGVPMETYVRQVVATLGAGITVPSGERGGRRQRAAPVGARAKGDD